MWGSLGRRVVGVGVKKPHLTEFSVNTKLISSSVPHQFCSSASFPCRRQLSNLPPGSFSTRTLRRFFSSSSSSPSSSVSPEEEKDNNNEGQGGGEGPTEFTLQLTEEEMEELTKGDPELIKKIKYIQLEHEVYKQEGINVPSRVRPHDWKELLSLPSPVARRKFYRFLFLNEMKRLSNDKKKLERKEKRLKEFEEISKERPAPEEDPYGVTYGLNRNTMFLRLYDTTINRHHYHRVTEAMRFGPKLVLDCGYDEFMTPKESRNAAKQIELLLSQNRSHREPFDLHLCNAGRDTRMLDYLIRINPALYDDTHPLHITEKSYLDIFPRDKLVYLSPHARDELDRFDEDEIYIIGGMVDKSDPRPFSMAKAKRENLQMKKLPLDRYLVWGLGNKSLTINQMIAILLDWKRTGDWKKALAHVPMRKLNRDFHPYPDQIQEREELKIRPAGRHESKSQVLEDFELMNRRKGFRGFNTSGPRKDKNEFGSYERRNDDRLINNRRNNAGGSRISARQLFDD